MTENGKSSKKLLKVNKPLTFGSTRVYLQANGYSPVVTVRDSQGNVALQGPCNDHSRFFTRICAESWFMVDACAL
ncbi:MAG: cytochrome c biogenesis protein ResB [Ilumatobacteraceae bacterium]